MQGNPIYLQYIENEDSQIMCSIIFSTEANQFIKTF